MTSPRRIDNSARRLTKALAGGLLASALIACGPALAASPAGERTANEPRESLYAACDIARRPTGARPGTEQDQADKDAAVRRKALCRLAAAAELSIRNNPGIF